MSQAALTTVVDERTTPIYTVVLRDQANNPVPSASLTALTLTYSNALTGAIINSRNAQNVLNANNGTYHATNGTFTWSLQEADTVIVDPTKIREDHIALIEWRWGTGNIGVHEAIFAIRNLANRG